MGGQYGEFNSILCDLMFVFQAEFNNNCVRCQSLWDPGILIKLIILLHETLAIQSRLKDPRNYYGNHSLFYTDSTIGREDKRLIEVA